MPDAGLLGKIPLQVTTTTNGWENLTSFPIAPNSTNRLSLEITAQETDTNQRASFARSGLYFRQLGTTQEIRVWQAPFTEKSSPGFDVRYQLTPTGVNFQVKAANNLPTLWKGSLEIHPVP